MTHDHTHTSHVYELFYGDRSVGYISLIPFPHPHLKKVFKIHRLVILPSFQGLGLASRLLDIIGKMYRDFGYKIGITTNNPALIVSMSHNPLWILKHKGRMGKNNLGMMRNRSSCRRITTSWYYLSGR